MAVTWRRLVYEDDLALMSWRDSYELTLDASGFVAFVSPYINYTLTPYNGGASDSLVKLSGVPKNNRVILRATDYTEPITVVSGMYLKLRGDFILNGEYDNIVLIGAGSDICYEESRCSSSGLYDDLGGDEDMRFGAAHELTISGGIAASDDSGASRNILIDTESDAASDDLDNITGYAEGDAIIISPANAGRTVVVKDNTNLNLQGVDFTMDDLYDSMFLVNIGGDKWKELSRSGN